MTQTVTGLFDRAADARSAVEALRGAGIPDSEISLVASNADNTWDDTETSTATTGAGTGAGVGAALGGAGGLLAGLGMIAIPGLGPVVAAGWLASIAVGALAGGAAGGAAGGVIGALTSSGVPEQDAHVYAEGVRRGGSLVTARVDDARADAVRAILRDSSAVDAAARHRAYREEGWETFDDQAPPYTRGEVETERSRYPLR